MITITWRMRWMAGGTNTSVDDPRPAQPPAALSATAVKTHRVTAAYPTAATVATSCWRTVGDGPRRSRALAGGLVERDGGCRRSVQRLGALGLRDRRRLVASGDHLGRQALALGADHEDGRLQEVELPDRALCAGHQRHPVDALRRQVGVFDRHPE